VSVAKLLGRRLTSEAGEDELEVGGDGDGGDGGASAGLCGCVCEFVPGMSGEVVGMQGGQSARHRTSSMDVQSALPYGSAPVSIAERCIQGQGVVASQRGCCVRVVVDRGETFPGDGVGGVESVERGFPDAGLDADERGHVDAATTAPDVERVGVGVMDGRCHRRGVRERG
jgi:hypothetical protein